MIKKVNYLNIKHELVPTHYKGDPKFINYFPIKDKPVAVYLVTDRLTKQLYGYKNYMMLFQQDGKYLISDTDELDHIVSAVKCESCEDIIYSCYRHDYHTCTCGKTTVDGGTDYLRTNSPIIGTLDLLTDIFKENKIVKNKKPKRIGTGASSRGSKKTKKRVKKKQERA